MRMLYKYPQAEFPYAKLREENARRGRRELEYELLDTGVFGENRYFDVFVTYAKASPEDILVGDRGLQPRPGGRAAPRPSDALVPQHVVVGPRRAEAARAQEPKRPAGAAAVAITHPTYGDRTLYAEGAPELLFTENETNNRRLFGTENDGPYVKDAFHERVVHGVEEAVNPAGFGTKAAAWYRLESRRAASTKIRLRLTDAKPADPLGPEFDAILAARRAEADAFYANVIPDDVSDDAKSVMRQSFGGLLWSKQYYGYEVARWLKGDPDQPPPPPERKHGRNAEWGHLYNADVISMPDKWEYPWYAAWDLAFHTVPLALVDPDFAKQQLILLLREWYMHPNGQLPAYEWKFSDVNPPVHAWAAWRVYKIDAKRSGKPDRKFLERVFHKLLLNFTWWVNRKDEEGQNVFQGGFLGPRQHRRLRPQRAAARPAATSSSRTARAGWACIA